MPALEIGVLATATAKLVAIGVDAWTAHQRQGWGVDEAKAFGNALASVPAFEPLLRRKPRDLTARTLAYTLAERFLTDHGSPSPDLAYPIFVGCQEAFRRRNLDAESAVRLAQKRAAESFLPSADPGDEAFAIPQHQKVVIIFDGLDEVQLSSTEAKDFFDDRCLGRGHRG